MWLRFSTKFGSSLSYHFSSILNSKSGCKCDYNLKTCTRFKMSTYILGIETSCDDTGAAVIDNFGTVLGESVATQTKLSVKLGGVLPSIAANLHEQNINSVVNSCLLSARISFKDLDCIAVTVKPGMPLSLKVGVVYAKTMARQYKLPIIPVHHMEAHALTALLGNPRLQFPYLVLLVSGGHCLLALARGLEDFVLLGTALDASPGDVLDKLARRLKLSRLGNDHLRLTSGGHAIELAASLYKGDPFRFELPLPRSQSRDCDFSFTGIHVAANQLVRRLENEEIQNDELSDLSESRNRHLSYQTIADICASIQYAMTRLICRRVQRAVEFIQYFGRSDAAKECNLPPPRALVVSGGVGANAVIRAGLTEIANSYGLQFIAPPSALCTDNGVMIAWNGLLLYRAGSRIVHDIDVIDFESKAPFGMDFRSHVRKANLPVKPIKLPPSVFGI